MNHTIDLLDTEAHRRAAKPKGLARRSLERGMATAEYAVGILAAAALALVLLRIVSDNRFFEELFKVVTRILVSVGSKIS